MAKKKDSCVVEKKDKKTDIVEKKPKKTAKNQVEIPELSEHEEDLIDNFISLLNEMKIDKDSAESKLNDLLEDEGIEDDYFQDYRGQFLNAAIIRYLEIYGALKEIELMNLFYHHFPYSTITETEFQDALEECFELYHAEDKLYVHPFLMDENMYKAYVPIILEKRKGKRLHPVSVAELMVFQKIVLWLPEYTAKAEDMIKKYKLKFNDMKEPDCLIQLIWTDIQCAMLAGVEPGSAFEKDFNKKKNEGLKDIYNEIVQHTRLWALNGKMMCE